jgi:hypothetical protein
MCNHWLHIEKGEDMGFQLAPWVCGLTGLLTVPAATREPEARQWMHASTR